MYLFSFAARRHQYRGFWKDETPISHLAGKEIWRWRKAFWNTGCSQIYTVLCIGTMPPSPQETQLLQGTAVCVLNTSDIHMHVKLISALCTGFPCSNSSSQSLFPCCPVACPENGKGHSLGRWTALSVRFLRHWGAFYHKGKQSPSAWEDLELLLAPAGEQVCRKDKKISGNYRKLKGHFQSPTL